MQLLPGDGTSDELSSRTAQLPCTCDGHFITAGQRLMAAQHALNFVLWCIKKPCHLTEPRLSRLLRNLHDHTRSLQRNTHRNGWFVLVFPADGWSGAQLGREALLSLAASLPALFVMEDPLGVTSLISHCCEIWKIFSERFSELSREGSLGAA